MHPLKPMPGASAYAERAEVSKIIKNTSWHELLPKSWRKLGASFQIMSYDILDFSWEKLVASESHLAVQQPSELKLVEVSLKYLSSTLLSPLSSWTGLNHAAAKHPRRGQGVAGIKQRVLMARSRTFWFCISLNQASTAGDIHQVHHGVISKVTVIFHRIDSFYWLLQLAAVFCHSFWMEEVAKTLWSFDETSAKNHVSTTKIHCSGGRDPYTSTKSCGSTWAESDTGGAWIFGGFFWRGWMCDYEKSKWRNLFANHPKHGFCTDSSFVSWQVGRRSFQESKRHWKNKGHVEVAGLRIEDATCRSFACSDSINEAGATENSRRWQNCTPTSRKNSRAAIPVEAEGSHRKAVKMYLVILCWFLWCKGFSHSEGFVCCTRATRKATQSIRPRAFVGVVAWRQIGLMAATKWWELCNSFVHWPGHLKTNIEALARSRLAGKAKTSQARFVFECRQSQEGQGSYHGAEWLAEEVQSSWWGRSASRKRVKILAEKDAQNFLYNGARAAARYDSGLARRACFSEIGIQVPLDA